MSLKNVTARGRSTQLQSKAVDKYRREFGFQPVPPSGFCAPAMPGRSDDLCHHLAVPGSEDQDRVFMWRLYERASLPA
jgi:hypothetical protein